MGVAAWLVSRLIIANRLLIAAFFRVASVLTCLRSGILVGIVIMLAAGSGASLRVSLC